MTPPKDAGDGQGPNMTPMIDIVFNLVTFFMLSVDLSRHDYAALSLPRAQHGTEDHVDAPAERRRLLVNLLGDGSVTFKTHVYPVGAPDREEAGRALARLVEDLRALAKTEPRDADGASTATVMVRGDRTAKWKYVQWVMQACADPQVRIAKIQFAVEGNPKDETPR